jgi:hypothetical protein
MDRQARPPLSRLKLDLTLKGRVTFASLDQLTNIPIHMNMSAFRTTTRLVSSRRPVAITQSLRFAPRWMSQDAQNKLLGADLQIADPAVYDIVQKVRFEEMFFVVW